MAAKSYLLCLVVMIIFSGCFLWRGPTVDPGNGVFEIKSINEDLAFVVTGGYKIKLYGIKYIANKKDIQKRLSRFVGTRIAFINGQSWIVRKSGGLFYEKGYEKSNWPFEPSLAGSSGEPVKDNNGAMLVIVLSTAHPNTILQEALIREGIAVLDEGNISKEFSNSMGKYLSN